MATLKVCCPGVRLSGMYTGLVVVPGHQFERLRSDEEFPLPKLPDEELSILYVPQSVRQGINSKTFFPSINISFNFWLNSSPLPQPPWPVAIYLNDIFFKPSGIFTETVNESSLNMVG